MDPNQVNQNQAPMQQEAAPEGPAQEMSQPQVILTPEEYAQFQRRDAEATAYQRQLQLTVGQQNARAAQEAYEREKTRVMDEGDPQKIEQFYEAKRQAEHQEIRNALIPTLAEGFRGEIAQQYGLNQQQAFLLGDNPDHFKTRAEILASQNMQQHTAQQLQEQSQLAFQAQQRGLSNHDRIGGMSGGSANVQPEFEKGSIDHLRYRLFGEGQTFVPD